ncbi:hypothetical protein D3C86_1687940 [compost metagenome]
MPSCSLRWYSSGKLSRIKAVSMAPSMTGWATWMPCGPSSRAMLWARARRANLAPAKAEKLARPRREALAPVKMMLPRARGSMTLAASRPVRKPARAAISQTLR